MTGRFQQQTFASGLRNPVGLDFHPTTGELYATVNEQTRRRLVPDYLTRATGQFYGWPYAYLTNNLDPRQAQNGKSKRPDKAASTQRPTSSFRLIQLPWDSSFMMAKRFQKNIATVPLSPFVVPGTAIAAPATQIVFVPFDANARPQATELSYRFPA